MFNNTTSKPLQLTGIIPQFVPDTTRLETVLQELNSRLCIVETKMFNIISGEINVGVATQAAMQAEEESLQGDEESVMKQEEFIDYDECINDSERVEAVHQMVEGLRRKIKKLIKDQVTRAAIQRSKDDAQDEVIKMEIDRIHRAIKTRLSHQDLQQSTRMMESKLTTLEVTIKSELAEKTHEIESSQENEISKIVDQVNNIKQATEEGYSLLEKRMEGGFTEMKKHSRERRSVARGFHLADSGGDDDDAENAARRNRFMKLELDVSTLTDNLKKLQEDLNETDEKQKKDNSLLTELEENTAKMEAQLMRLKMEVKEQFQKDLEQLSFEMNGEGGKMAQLQKQIEESIAIELESLRKAFEATTHETGDQMETLTQDLNKGMMEMKDTLSTIVESQIKQLETTIGNLQETTFSHETKTRSDVTDIKKALAQVRKKIDSNLEPTQKQHSEMVKELVADIAAHKTATQNNMTDSFNQLTQSIQRTNRRTDGLSSNLADTNQAISSVKSSLEDSNKSTSDHLEKLNVNMNKRLEEAMAILSRYKVTMDSMFTALERRTNGIGDQMTTVERSNIALASIVRQVEASVRILSTKHLFWDGLQTKLQAHMHGMGDHCCELEASSSSSRAFSLPYDVQKYLAGNVQRIAKFIAIRADFETIRQISATKHPEDEDWDQKVNFLRDKYVNEFLIGVEAYVSKKHRSGDFIVLETRKKFQEKLDQALKLAMSKYNKIQPGLTLFGKRQLQAPACMACDRPFTSDPGPGFSGSAKPVESDPARSKPTRARGSTAAFMSSSGPLGDYAESLDKDSDLNSVASVLSRTLGHWPNYAFLGRNRHIDIDNPSVTEFNSRPATVGGSRASSRTGSYADNASNNSGKQTIAKKGQKYVYRGGFKIPKDKKVTSQSHEMLLTPTSSVASSDGVSPASRNHSRRPHTVGGSKPGSKRNSLEFSSRNMLLHESGKQPSAVAEESTNSGTSGEGQVEVWPAADENMAKLPIISPF